MDAICGLDCGRCRMKAGSGRSDGLAADEKYWMVREAGGNGSDAEIILFKKRSEEQ